MLLTKFTAAAAAFACRGRTLAQVTLIACNVFFVALHIQLGRGTVAHHFQVFVLLGLLLDSRFITSSSIACRRSAWASTARYRPTS